MSNFVRIFKWAATLGREPQTFLGAAWIPAFLRRVGPEKKRIWALRILSLSPHYFINADAPEYRDMTNDEFLETAYRESAESRQKIYDHLLKGFLNEDDVVLDYGCGPGFLARIVAEQVEKVYACDISTGALECARIINPSERLEYVVADKKGLSVMKDESIDAVYSFAMVQHVTDEIFEGILENCR